MTSRIARSIVVVLAVGIGSCAERPSRSNEPGVAVHPARTLVAVEGEASVDEPKLSGYENLSPEHIYEKVSQGIPDDVRQLVTQPFAHSVGIGDAQREFQVLARSVAATEIRGFAVPAAELQGSASRMFADWSRMEIGGVESLQELDTDESPSSGPGDEVLLHNGELRFQQIDYSLPGRSGLGLTFARMYRSHVDYDGPLGQGWDHNHNQRLIINDESFDTATEATWYSGSRRVVFQREGDAWSPEAGAFYRLFSTAGLPVIETPELGRLTFERAGVRNNGRQAWRIRTIASRHDGWRANTLQYTYEGDRLARIVDAFGNQMRLYHCKEGRLRELRRGSTIVRYRYDEEGRLTTVTIPSVAYELERSTDVRWSFDYRRLGENGRPTLAAATPPGGPKQVFEYGQEPGALNWGRVCAIRFLPGGPDNDAQQAGILASWEFDRRQDAAAESYTVAVTPPPPLPAFTYTFPVADGQAQQTGRFPSSRSIVSRQATWQLTFNEDGLLTEEVLPLGGRQTFEYDSDNPSPVFRGNLLAVREYARPGPNDLGIVEIGTTRKYHTRIALPIEERTYQVASDGEQETLRVQTWDYDEPDFVVVCSRVGREGSVLVRNRFGLVVAELDSMGIATLNRYYAQFGEGTVGVGRGGLLAERVRDIDPKRLHAEMRLAGITPSKMVKIPSRDVETPPVAQTVRYTYNTDGLPIREEHDGYEIRSIYNKMNLLLCRYDTRTDLHVVEYDQSLRPVAEYRRMTFPPDAEYQGERRLGITGRFYKERFTYDEMANLQSWIPTEELLGPDGKSAPVVAYTRYASGVINARTTPGGNTVGLVYEEATGHIRRMTLASNQDSLKRLTLRRDVAYDAEGFRTGYVDDLGQRHTFKPDPFGRPFSETSPDGIEQQTFLDGLGRPFRRVTMNVKDGLSKVIGESLLAYNAEGHLRQERTRRMGESTDGQGNDVAIDEWLVTREFRYDAAGHPIQVRSVRHDAWTRMQYDGLGRVILTEDPEGDREALYYRYDQPVVRIYSVTNQATGQVERLCDVAVLDSKCRPWLFVRVGTDGSPAFSRAVVHRHDSQGRQVEAATPGLTRTVTILDSLDRVVQETALPIGQQHGEEARVARNKYDPDGRITERTVFNSPMAVFVLSGKGPVNAPPMRFVEPSRVPVPQTTRNEYDEFGRLRRTTLPDGLVRTNTYNAGSMVETITATHLDHAEFRQVIRLEYDSVRRTIGVRDERHRSIQAFQYDEFGNTTRGEDRGNAGWPVTIERRFDNLGNLLYETTLSEGGPREIRTVYEHDLPNGKRKVRLLGLEGQREALWQEKTFHADRAGRIRGIGVDGNDAFCHYLHVGTQVIRKTLPESGTELKVDTSPLLEPVAYSLQDVASQTMVSQLAYNLDSHGRVGASAARVPRMQWQRSQFYQHDSHGILIGEVAEDRVFDNLEDRRATVLHNPASPGSWRTRWSRYDEASNLTTTFRKTFAGTGPWGHSHPGVAVSYDAQYYSPGKHFHLALTDGSEGTRKQAIDGYPLKPAERRELASNRLATVATRQTVQQFEYDELGRLIEFPSLTSDRDLTWQIEYDLLGRATRMAGFKSNSEEPDIELRFVSDVFNRRVVKHVQDHSRIATSVTVTTYLGLEPTVVMQRGGEKDASWNVSAQYLWGPGDREIIMAVLPAATVEQRQTQRWGRYFLHQDRMLNVFLCTGLKDGEVEVFDIASFWGFGENSTTANLVSIDSTAEVEEGTDPRTATDRILDSERASWLSKNPRDRITLTLDQPAQMSDLTIWTDNFPEGFRVYVVPEGEDAAPAQSELGRWEEDADRRQWLAARYHQVEPKAPGIQDPYKVPLYGRNGHHIVIVWDAAAALSVREFEVTVIPRNPSSLAFAGQWLDRETGLYYHGARYRLPTMGGKFICPDPLGFLDGDNLYAYAHNDPLTWHDPDGQFAHILYGAGVGAGLGAGSYLFQVWMTGEEFSWAKLGIHAGVGAASGAIAAATFGAVSPALVNVWGGSAIAGAAAGGAGGATHGAISAGLMSTVVEQRGAMDSLLAAGKGASIQGFLGALGGGAGGAVLSTIPLNIHGSVRAVLAGAAGGGSSGAVMGGVRGYSDTGTVAGTLRGATVGGGRGMAAGGVLGAAFYGVGQASAKWRPLPRQPEGIPDPRTVGTLVRTPRPQQVTYGNHPTQPGLARHHEKPLSLGGSDTAGNIKMIDLNIHRQPHPGTVVDQAKLGTIFY